MCGERLQRQLGDVGGRKGRVGFALTIWGASRISRANRALADAIGGAARRKAFDIQRQARSGDYP
jgi:hypothetical protein